ncbi:5-oxoprolinase, partial [Amylocystis lapponica]
VEFIDSDGSPLGLNNFRVSGLKSILSGPGGGVARYALTPSCDETETYPIIGLDVSGTSTDASRFDERYEMVYKTMTAGVTIQSLQLEINTVSVCLTFCKGLFLMGP